MNLKPINKIPFLERKVEEWKAKYKAEHNTVCRLSKTLKTMSEKASLITQYKETITINEDTIRNLRERISKLESKIKELNSDNWRAKNELQRLRENYDKVMSEIEAEKNPQRLEDYLKGRFKDRWGLFFFDEELIPNFNPYNGKKIFINSQCALMRVLTKYYKEIWEGRKEQLGEYRKQLDNDEINIDVFSIKKDQLGRELWSIIEDDWRVKEILSANL